MRLSNGTDGYTEQKDAKKKERGRDKPSKYDDTSKACTVYHVLVKQSRWFWPQLNEGNPGLAGKWWFVWSRKNTCNDRATGLL